MKHYDACKYLSNGGVYVKEEIALVIFFLTIERLNVHQK